MLVLRSQTDIQITLKSRLLKLLVYAVSPSDSHNPLQLLSTL